MQIFPKLLHTKVMGSAGLVYASQWVEIPAHSLTKPYES